jgi:ferredoxin
MMIELLVFMSHYRITHDRKACIGCGACVSVCPENWEMIEKNGEFKAKPKKLDINEDEYNSNSEASTICPVECIQIEKIKVKKRSAEEMEFSEEDSEDSE